MRQSLVLCETVNDEIYTDDVYKVEIQTRIDDEVYYLLASVPPLVDVDVSL
jgi:hypothetical protein